MTRILLHIPASFPQTAQSVVCVMLASGADGTRTAANTPALALRHAP